MTIPMFVIKRCLPTIVLLLLGCASAIGQLDFEQAPIRYLERQANNPVEELQRRLDAGETKLEYDVEHGYLPAVLRELGISKSSQMLVFSKTSFQLTKIMPQRPRAVYFNDHTYVGWVQEGDVVELSTTDPDLGGMFYTLSQDPEEPVRFVRDRGQCLACHASSRTQGVPGHLVRSVYTSRSGQPHFGSGTFTTDDRSPFSERWGGWYVSGTHGTMRHMGNVLSEDRGAPEKLDREAGANITDLSRLLNLEPYLSRSSDIVALMVLEHQTQMHNVLTHAHYTAVQAAYQDQIVNKALKRGDDYQSESAERRIASAGDKVLERLLFCDEFQLTASVSGSQEFADDFLRSGPFDGEGRSLRDFDLQQRLFKYPCSYLIYSTAFDQLPKPVHQYIVNRLWRILREEDDDPKYRHLTSESRAEILEILQDTKPALFASCLESFEAARPAKP